MVKEGDLTLSGEHTILYTDIQGIYYRIIHLKSIILSTNVILMNSIKTKMMILRRYRNIHISILCKLFETDSDAGLKYI